MDLKTEDKKLTAFAQQALNDELPVTCLFFLLIRYLPEIASKGVAFPPDGYTLVTVGEPSGTRKHLTARSSNFNKTPLIKYLYASLQIGL